MEKGLKGGLHFKVIENFMSSIDEDLKNIILELDLDKSLIKIKIDSPYLEEDGKDLKFKISYEVFYPVIIDGYNSDIKVLVGRCSGMVMYDEKKT